MRSNNAPAPMAQPVGQPLSSTVLTPLSLLEQASAFLTDVAHERGLWPAVLHRWAERQGLSPTEAEDLRRVILRQRVLEAMAHHRAARQ